MSTTTIRIDDDLKRRVAAAAQHAGKTTHAFILDALTQTLEPLERDDTFHQLADQRWAKILATRETVPEVFDDFDRFFGHLTSFEAEESSERIADIVQAIEILTRSPLIGRPVRAGKRELVIGRGSRGYLVLYRFIESADTVFILAIRDNPPHFGPHSPIPRRTTAPASPFSTVNTVASPSRANRISNLAAPTCKSRSVKSGSQSGNTGSNPN